MECAEITYTGHAVQRMFQRSIGTTDVEEAVGKGEIIAEYPDDQPFPSTLLLSEIGGRALHVVVSRDGDSGRCYVITAYFPDPRSWSPDFRQRS